MAAASKTLKIVRAIIVKRIAVTVLATKILTEAVKQE